MLRGMVELADHNRLVPGLIELFARLSTEAASPDHPAHQYFLDRYARIRRNTVRALAGAVRAGHLRADLNVAAAGLQLTALMDGLQTQWLFDRSIDMAGSLRLALEGWLTEAGRTAYDLADPVFDPAMA